MFKFDYKGYNFRCDIGTMTPKQYERLIDLLEDFKPRNICEMGSGESTKIFEKYKSRTGASLYSIEHDKFYARGNAVMFPLVEKINFKIGGIDFGDCSIYRGFEEWLGLQGKFDLVFSDGPNDTLPYNYNNLIYSRIQVVDFPILDKLSDNSIVMYHDCQLTEAKNTLEKFEDELLKRGFAFSKEEIVEDNMEVVKYNENVLGFCPNLLIYKCNPKN